MNVSDAKGLPEQARGSWITANVFSLIGQPAFLGRDFSPADEQKGADPVAIISYSFWKNRYGGDANVIGTPIRVNGEPATIIGVMADRCSFRITQRSGCRRFPTTCVKSETLEFSTSSACCGAGCRARKRAPR